MNVPYVIVCGEKVNHPNVKYRQVKGKWDAINYSINFVPCEAKIIVFNDVDNTITNFSHVLEKLNQGKDIVYCKISVAKGPQVKFYKLLDPIRKSLHVAANGDLMVMRREVLDRVLPIPPCIAEDSYILFKALELGYRAHFSTVTYVKTEKSPDALLEEKYKIRTTLGIYQALNYAKPPIWIRIFYSILPAFAPMLFIAGKDGKAWALGIEKAVNARIKKTNPTKF